MVELRDQPGRVLPGDGTAAALTGFIGLAVILVMLQSSGGFAVELLGADLLLTSAGFAVTHSVLTRRESLDLWYGRQLVRRGPLLVGMIAAVVAAVAVVGPYTPGGMTTSEALSTVVSSFTWWDVAPRAGSTSSVDPLGSMWLIGLLAQYSLVWPLLLVGLCRALRVRNRRRVLVVLTPVLVGVAFVAWLAGPLRSLLGAGVAELTLSALTRAAEWLVGAAAAAAVLGMRRHPRPASSWETPGVALTGAALLVAMGVAATLHPEDWLRLGGPGAASLGAAVLLIALHVPPDGPLSRTLSRGLPAEIGRMAYPLLLLHLPLFWAVQLVVPSARPFALLTVGGTLAWLLGLLLQDGVIRRWQARPLHLTTALLIALVAFGAVAVSADSLRSAAIGVGRSSPVLLVVGGSSAGDVAAALSHPGSPFTIVDASRPGCGLLPATAAVTTARTTTQAQAPVGLAECGDGAAQWRARIEAVRPDAVIVDLANDAARTNQPGRPGPCDAAYREPYRELFAQAVAAWTEDARDRPVLLATVPHNPGRAEDLSRRCQNGLVVELTASYRSVLPLDLDAVLCPYEVCRTTTAEGRPLYDDYGRLSPAGVSDLAPWLQETVAGDLGRVETARATSDCENSNADGC
jgi:peptidoglycan/LPS O-acetylase OafA/YrhL